MLGYYLELAIRRLRGNIALNALLVLIVGFGMGASMTVLSTLRAMALDPIPDKSAELFVPQIDPWGPPTQPGGRSDTGGDLPDLLTYRDAMALMQARQAARQTAIYSGSLDATGPDGAPIPVNVCSVYADFFSMFEVPFRAGHPWSAADDAGGGNVVIVSSKLADRLFPHAKAVGKTISLQEQVYRIVGVMDIWNPVPRYYDLAHGYSGLYDAADVFLPFSTAINRRMELRGRMVCNSHSASVSQGRLNSECVWIGFWVELPTAASVRDYRAFLYNYAAEQRQLGRFHWQPRVALRDVRKWMQFEIAIPDTLRVSTLVAFGFLTVCLVNAAGLMLARFSSRAGDLGIRRALGASRWQICLQCLAEAAVVGLPAGLLGLGLTVVGLYCEESLQMIAFADANPVARVTSLDSGMIVITFVLAVCAMLCSAAYPVWRASQVQPAWQLKTQ